VSAATGARLLNRLREIVGPEHAVTGTRLAEYGLGGQSAITPEAVVFPRDESEVSRVLRLAWEDGLGVVPWGGGNHQAVGRPPARYHLALDLGRLNRMLEHEPADMTATAQAGIRLGDLQRRLGSHGQFLSLDPPLAADASLGGVLATNLSGPIRCRYGAARDLVLGIRVAQADGTVTTGGAKVVKNVTGYDITKLYIGSLGTLGVILEATFRVYPQPAAERGWWLPVPDVERGLALAIRILGSHLVPNRVELLEAGAAQACGAGHGGAQLLVSCAGVPEAVQAHAAELVRLAGETGTTPTEVSQPDRTWKALSDFPWRNEDRGGRPLRVIWRGGVLPTDCAKAMQAIREATSPWAQTSVAASVAPGSLRGEIRASAPDGAVRSVNEARQALGGLGGYFAVLDAPASVRDQVDVWGGGADSLPLMRRLKAAFDTKGILSPGRYVGGI
jgi:glycolate oxidase FAD binding subunit